MTRADILRELARHGVEGWLNEEAQRGPAWIPLAELETSHAESMLERYRTRDESRRCGAAPCAEHAGEFAGACPWCRGLWHRDQGAFPVTCKAAERRIAEVAAEERRSSGDAALGREGRIRRGRGAGATED